MEVHVWGRVVPTGVRQAKGASTACGGANGVVNPSRERTGRSGIQQAVRTLPAGNAPSLMVGAGLTFGQPPGDVASLGCFLCI